MKVVPVRCMRRESGLSLSQAFACSIIIDFRNLERKFVPVRCEQPDSGFSMI